MANLSLQLRYLQHEDRILVRLGPGDPPVQFWLTRRLTVGMLKALVPYAVRPAPSAVSAEAVAAPAVAERHHAAVSAIRPALPAAVADGGEAEIPDADEAPALLQQVKVGRSGSLTVLLLPIGDSEHRVPLTDADLLRVIDIVYRKSIEAGWGLEDLVPWLRESYFGAGAAARRSAAN